MRYLIKYSKESEIKFISHLDLMRTIQRVIRRADLPIEYSKGFNPHMNVSIAQPLSVGMYSWGEYMDVGLSEELEEEYIKDKLRGNLPEGIRIIEVTKVRAQENKKIPQAMALIDGARYSINIKYINTTNLDKEICKVLNEKEWITIKRGKNGEKSVDIKPMIKDFKYEILEQGLKLEVLVSCGSKENLSAELIAKYIKENTTEAILQAFVDVKREEMYVYYENELIPLYKYMAIQ